MSTLFIQNDEQHLCLATGWDYQVGPRTFSLTKKWDILQLNEIWNWDHRAFLFSVPVRDHTIGSKTARLLLREIDTQ